MKPYYSDDFVTIYHGDCRGVLRLLDADSLDACVTDPPYHLTNNMGTRSPMPGQYTPIGRPKEPKGGFMGKKWDGGDVAFRIETWREVYRVLKPGAHLVAFGGTRTYHRMVCAIEDAGFEIRDQIGWLYGSGFPKSHDISKAIDRESGAKREVVAVNRNGSGAHLTKLQNHGAGDTGIGYMDGSGKVFDVTAPATEEAKQWQGWGTALKPAWEPIVLARKPLVGTVAENVQRFGTGAINIDACRVEGEAGSGVWGSSNKTVNPDRTFVGSPGASEYRTKQHPKGRWPANIVHDGSDEVVSRFPMTESGKPCGVKAGNNNKVFGQFSGGIPVTGFGDYGSAARFFYCAKASSDERFGDHPTVKPKALMQWLIRLICPAGGKLVDAFAGSGSTLEAAKYLGVKAIGIDTEKSYCELAIKRLTQDVLSLDNTDQMGIVLP